MNERIREFLIAENKSSAQLAEEIGVQPSGISHILSGRNNPSLDFVLKMLEKYQLLSTEWLLFGKGAMYKDSRNQSLFDESNDLSENEASNQQRNELQERDFEPTSSFKTDNRVNMQESGKRGSRSVMKIVWFYNDNSFEEYYPIS